VKSLDLSSLSIMIIPYSGAGTSTSTGGSLRLRGMHSSTPYAINLSKMILFIVLE
jgi:hypothetical protein